MGEDAISPYYPYLEQNKGVFALVKTSNPSGKGLSGPAGGRRKRSTNARRKKYPNWGERFIGKSGFSAIGAVTGQTIPEEFERIRPLAAAYLPAHSRLRRTGRKGQRDIAGLFQGRPCAVWSNPPPGHPAHKGKCEDEHFTDSVRAAVLDMKKGHPAVAVIKRNEQSRKASGA
jgi:orotidine-5'-phosphate decarboxylase